jgi:hypothetical protein
MIASRLGPALAMLALASTAQADDWPAWRGPTRDGLSAERNLPVEWAPDRNVLWKAPLPAAAGATPVIWGERIFLTSPSADGDRLSELKKKVFGIEA